jgi:hypothetical protein
MGILQTGFLILATCHFALVCLFVPGHSHRSYSSGYGVTFKKLMVGIINKYFILHFTSAATLRLTTVFWETLG